MLAYIWLKVLIQEAMASINRTIFPFVIFVDFVVNVSSPFFIVGFEGLPSHHAADFS